MKSQQRVWMLTMAACATGWGGEERPLRIARVIPKPPPSKAVKRARKAVKAARRKNRRR